MGTWGIGPLENDAALDLQGKFEEQKSLHDLKKVFSNFLELPENKREADLCQEVVAAIHLWVEYDKKADADFIQKALVCFDFVMTRSELKDMWGEGDELNEWLKELGLLAEKMASKLQSSSQSK